VQRRRDARAAAKLRRKLLKKQGFAPETLVTDRLRSYGSAKTRLGLSARHEQGLRKNIGSRIRICRCDDASTRCKGSNRLDRRNGSYPFTPPPRPPLTFNAISLPRHAPPPTRPGVRDLVKGNGGMSQRCSLLSSAWSESSCRDNTLRVNDSNNLAVQ
jgi:hypothetical protein